jgi:hypothetical protein
MLKITQAAIAALFVVSAAPKSLATIPPPNFMAGASYAGVSAYAPVTIRKHRRLKRHIRHGNGA